MKIHYWGTAAAEGIPSVFCACAVCRSARETGGRAIRTRSQLLLDDSLLVDFGADTYMHSLKYGFDMSRLEHVFITHIHCDHYYPYELLMRRVGFSHNMSGETLTVYGSPDVPAVASRVWDAQGNIAPNIISDGRLRFDVMKPYESREAAGFKVTALPATHGTDNPYVYIFEKEGRAMLLHNDSGYFKPEVLEFIKASGIKFDLVSYECTYATSDATSGGKHPMAGHLGLPNALEERRRLIELGCYKESTLDVLTHFSHNPPNAGYFDMKPYAEKEGFILAYDGMILEI